MIWPQGNRLMETWYEILRHLAKEKDWSDDLQEFIKITECELFKCVFILDLSKNIEQAVKIMMEVLTWTLHLLYNLSNVLTSKNLHTVLWYESFYEDFERYIWTNFSWLHVFRFLANQMGIHWDIINFGKKMTFRWPSDRSQTVGN